MRLLRLLVILLCVVSLLAPDAADAKRRSRSHGRNTGIQGVNDPRYAAIIMNPQTGEIYHQKDAYERRYPASLTKMMTLYLLFEALDKGDLSLNTRLYVSDYATTMPQTNLSLNAGDEIPVDTVIKALVVRSANDVSVVVAEALGGSVDRFATMMTEKAHSLGMRNTNFENPNGLPNDNQYTTAHDMAKLGIALKRDFPHYYPYFSVREFSWAGTAYFTHNRVMLRYAGVDGIKTGYIGSSGFNLVTSCKRGGRPLLGVVMGGGSGRWRDDRMITLLNEGYQILASRGATKGKIYTANLPMSKGGTPIDSDTTPVIDVVDTAPPDTAEVAPAPEISRAVKPVAPIAPPAPKIISPPTSTPFAVAQPPLNVQGLTITPETPVTLAPPKPSRMLNPLAVPPPVPTTAPPPPLPVDATPSTTRQWGIQVGAFASKKLAKQAAQKAFLKAAADLQGAKVNIMPPEKGGARVYRARLDNITEHQATRACAIITANQLSCFTYRSTPRPNNGQSTN